MKNSDFIKLDSFHRRERILDVACELFSKKGYDAVTTIELSQTAGCSESMLLGLFPAKAEIYNTLFAEWEIIVNKEPTLNLVNNSPLNTLEKFFSDFTLKKYSRDPSMRTDLERALYSRTSGGAKKKMYQVAAAAPDFVSCAIVPLVKNGQEKGEIVAGDPLELANLVWSITQGCLNSKKDFSNRYKTVSSSIIRDILKNK